MLSVFFNIIRWKELLYFTFILFLFKYCFLYGCGFKTTLSFLDLSILALATSFIIATGYLSSYYRRKKGKKNVFALSKIKKFVILFSFSGIFLGILLSFKISKPYYSFIFICCLIATIIYAANTMNKTFINSIGRSFLKPFIILIVLWFDAPINLTPDQWDLFFKLQSIAILFAILSFLSNLLRDTVIDINRIDYDYSRKNTTLPVILGRKRTKSIALILVIAICIIVLYFSVTYIKDRAFLLSIFLLCTIPELIIIYFLINANGPKGYKLASKAINIAYLLGIFSIPIVTYYFKYVIK